MKKRVTGLLLALCLCLTLLPGTAGAAYEPTEVSQVSVSVAAPTAGSDLTESTPAVADSQPYFVDSSSWTRIAAEGCFAAVDSWENRSDTFVKDSWYLLRVNLLLDRGYAYSSSVTASIPGAESSQLRRSKDDTVVLSAWFKVGAPVESPVKISTVSVSNVKASWTGKVSDWEDDIQDNAAVGDDCRISDRKSVV